MKHDTNTVHAFIATLITFLKNTLEFKNCIYFSDGASSQYKNYKNFINLCKHKEDFGIDAEWNFFATSHAKSPCDGIGGTVKRLVAWASLQMIDGGCIDTPQQMFNWCCKSITGINFCFISNDHVSNNVTNFKLEERYSQCMTVPGTKSHHSYIPQGYSMLQIRRISIIRCIFHCL